MVSPHPLLPPLGFVVALHGTIIGEAGVVRREWLIASRWGSGGAYLSVARTLITDELATIAPPHLAPRWSALAVLDTTASQSGSPCFTFTEQCPAGLVLAGRFAPSLGNVRVDVDAASIHLQGNVHCLLRNAEHDFRFEGVWAAWIGEFIETRT